MDKAGMQRLLRHLIPNVGTLILVGLMLFVYRASAEPAAQGTTPGVISYQGTLTNAAGQPVNGATDITFRLYNTSTGGQPLWQEARTGANAVPVNSGQFSVLLGGLNPIPATLWNAGSLYLGIQVGEDIEMQPRELIGSVPAAISVSDRSITRQKLAPGAVATSMVVLTYDGYATWLSTAPQRTGPGWTTLTDPHYRPLTLTVATDAVLDVSLTTHLRSSEHRAAVIIVVDGQEAAHIYTASLRSTAVSDRVLYPVGPGTHTVEVRYGSWDPTTV